MQCIVLRPMTVGKRKLRRGTVVNTRFFDDDAKVAQLIALRHLRPRNKELRAFVATKPFTMRGKRYAVGEHVDVDMLLDARVLTDVKLAQLCEQRYLMPQMQAEAAA